MKQKAVEWQKANPEKKKASDHKRWLKPGEREKLRARLDKFQAEHPDEYARARKESARRWRKLNPEKTRATQERFRKTVKYRQLQRRHRATERHKERHRLRMRIERKRATYKVREMLRLSTRLYGERLQPDVKLLAVFWAALVVAFDSKCAYCGCPGDVVSLTIDHMTPKVRGGTDDPHNLAPACRNCNSAKRDKTVEEFEVYAVTVVDTHWRFSAAEIRARSEQVFKSHLTSAQVGG